jgi:hypothetical protein
MRGLLIVEAVLLFGLAAVAVRQRASGQGIESGYLALAILLGPAHLGRLLALAGRLAPARSMTVLAVIEAAALAGAASYPVPPGSLAVALAVALALARGTDDTTPRRPAERILEALLLLAVVLATAVDLARDPGPIAKVRAAAFAVVLAEALSPRRPRSPRDLLRRGAACAVVAGTSLVLTGIWTVLTTPPRLAPILVAVPILVQAISARIAPARRPAVRRLLMRLAAPPLVLLVLCAIAELGFHVVPNRYRELVFARGGYWHVPGREYVYEGAHLSRRQPYTNVVRWNTRGWHDVDHELAKPRGTTRFIVLGDSFVEGVQVSVDELYHRRLAGALAAHGGGRVEGINLGWSGWGQVQELECLRREGLSYDPDLAILEFLPGNDVRNNDDELEELSNREAFQATFARVLFAHCVEAKLHFPAFVCDQTDLTIRRFQGRKDAVDTDVYRAQPSLRPELWRAAWARTESLVGAMRDALAARGVGLVVVIFTSEYEVQRAAAETPPMPGEIDTKLPAQRMSEICARLGVPCLDLAPRFARRPPEIRSRIHLDGDGHWSATGHAIAAEETAKFLLEETDAWKEAVAHSAR